MLEEGEEGALQLERRIELLLRVEVRRCLHLMKLVLGESGEVLA